MCICVYLCVCLCVCASVQCVTCVQGPMKAKRKYQILLEVGVTGGCKVPKIVLGTSSLNTVNMRIRSVFFSVVVPKYHYRSLLSFCLVRIHLKDHITEPLRKFRTTSLLCREGRVKLHFTTTRKQGTKRPSLATLAILEHWALVMLWMLRES